MDTLSAEKRSWNMSRITGRNTKPELLVRSLLHRAGYRFRLHRSELPGKPDIVLPRYKVVVFVNGCFWHRHVNCPYAYVPKSRAEFWLKKFDDTIKRDQRQIGELKAIGWRPIVVWECEIRETGALKERLITEIHA